MAEFCLECWNKLNKTHDPAEKYIIDDELGLCEGCGEYKHTIIMERRGNSPHVKRRVYSPLKRRVVSPFMVIVDIFDIVFRFLIIPYNLYLMRKKRKKITTVIALVVYLAVISLLFLMVRHIVTA